MNNGCRNDSCKRTIEELMKACEKHRNAALAVKEIADNQKQKLRDYREANSNLYSEIDDLESDVKEKDDFANKLAKKRNELENEVKHLSEKIKAKNEDILKMDVVLNKQKVVSCNVVKALENKNPGLRDELESENMKIKSLGSDKKDSIEIKALNDKLLKAVIEMKELKEKILRGNLSACNLEEQLKAKEASLKDLEDEIDA